MGAHALAWPDRPPRANDLVGALVARRDVGQRDVGEFGDEGAERGFHLGALPLQPIECRAGCATALDQLLGRLALLLQPADFLGDGIARRPLLLLGLDRRTPTALEVLGAVERRSESLEHPTPAERITQGLG